MLTDYLQGRDVQNRMFVDAIRTAQSLLVYDLTRWTNSIMPHLETEVLAVVDGRMCIAHRLNDGWHRENGELIQPECWQVVRMPHKK